MCHAFISTLTFQVTVCHFSTPCPLLQNYFFQSHTLDKFNNRNKLGNILKTVTHAGLEIKILEPMKIVRKLLLVHFFVHKFIWEPVWAFHHPVSANLLFCSCYFKACTHVNTALIVKQTCQVKICDFELKKTVKTWDTMFRFSNSPVNLHRML